MKEENYEGHCYKTGLKNRRRENYREKVIEGKKDREDTVFQRAKLSFPDVLCNPTELVWRKGTTFEAMTGRSVLSSNSLLAEVF